MSTIQLEISDIEKLKKRISKMIDEIDDCYRDVSKIASEIDMKVRRRKDIDSDLQQIKEDLKKQREFLTQCEKIIGESINEFVEAEKIDKVPDVNFSLNSASGISNAGGIIKALFSSMLIGTGLFSLAEILSFFSKAKSWGTTVSAADYPAITDYINSKFPDAKKNNTAGNVSSKEREHGGGGRDILENNDTSVKKEPEIDPAIKQYQERLAQADSLETMKQPYSGPCPQYATLNMLRRKEIIDSGETTVTIDDVVKSNDGKLNYSGWKNDMCGYDMKVERGMQLEGKKSTVTTEHFNELLSSRPEGVVIYSKYAANKYHAITVTGYNAETGQYYVMDSADSSSAKTVVPYEDSWMATKLGSMDDMIKNCNKIYYIE